MVCVGGWSNVCEWWRACHAVRPHAALDAYCTPCPVESFCKCRHGRAHARQLRQHSLLDLLDVFVTVAAVPWQPCRGVAVGAALATDVDRRAVTRLVQALTDVAWARPAHCSAWPPVHSRAHVVVLVTAWGRARAHGHGEGPRQQVACSVTHALSGSI